jgi:hypothetical protein
MNIACADETVVATVRAVLVEYLTVTGILRRMGDQIKVSHIR